MTYNEFLLDASHLSALLRMKTQLKENAFDEIIRANASAFITFRDGLINSGHPQNNEINKVIVSLMKKAADL